MTSLLNCELVSRAKLCLVRVFADIVKDCLKMRNLLKTFLISFENLDLGTKVALTTTTVSISAKLKLYNTCILPIFLYGSECWAVTKRDVFKIDTLNHWRLQRCRTMFVLITSDG